MTIFVFPTLKPARTPKPFQQQGVVPGCIWVVPVLIYKVTIKCNHFTVYLICVQTQTLRLNWSSHLISHLMHRDRNNFKLF